VYFVYVIRIVRWRKPSLGTKLRHLLNCRTSQACLLMPSLSSKLVAFGHLVNVGTAVAVRKHASCYIPEMSV